MKNIISYHSGRVSMTSEGISHFMGINALQPQRSPVTIISSLAVENEKNNLFLDLKSLISQKCLIPLVSVCIPMHFFWSSEIGTALPP